MKNNLLNNFIFVLSVILVIGIVVWQNNLGYVFIWCSAIAVLIGCCMCGQKRKIGTLVVSLGISGVVTYLIYMNKILSFDDSVTFMISLSVGLMILLTDIIMYMNRKDVLKKYNIIVIGEVVDLEKNKNTKKEYYKAIYKYKFGDEIFLVDDPRYRKFNIPNIGDKREILIDPDEIKNTYFLPDKFEDLKVFIISMFFIVGAIVIIISLF